MSDEMVYTTRRDFITGGLTLLSAATTMPIFLGRTALALGRTDAPRAASDGHRILVVVQLAGGNDGLNTIVPYDDDEYRRARPELALRESDTLRLERGVGLHNAATGLKELYDNGLLSIVQNVGYPNPNRSHFTSSDIWMTADPTGRRKSGWLGRYFDAQCSGADPHTAPDSVSGVALTQTAPLALQGDTFAPLAFDDANALQWRGPQGDERAAAAFGQLNNRGRDGAVQTSGSSNQAAFLQRAVLDAQVGAETIRAALRRGANASSFAGQLETVASLIRADLPTQVYYVSLGGFDTHANQRPQHERLMRTLGDGLAGFVKNLQRDKLLDRVMIMTFSEFGRRVEENASRGTDHGQAAPMFLVGGEVDAGLHGRMPNLRRLNEGDIPFEVDFRDVYAGVLREWFDADAKDVVDSRRRIRLLRRGRRA